MSTILLTGGTGFIGSHVAVELLQHNYQIIIIDNLSNSYADVINNIEKITKTRIKFYQCDINNYDHLNQVFQENTIDSVIHLAGHKSVEESVSDPLKYYENNVGGLIVLLKCMKSHNVNKIIFSSSAAVYGNSEILPLTEESETNPLNPYGSSKLISENILKNMSGFSIIILRYFNPVGSHYSGLLKENPCRTASNLFPVIMSIYDGKKEHLQIFGTDHDTKDGTAIRDYIHITDLARGHVKSLDYIQQNDIKYQTFNLGTGSGHSILEVINGFERHSGKKLPFILENKRKGDSSVSFAGCKKANELLGWNVKHNLDDMIKSTLGYKTTFVTAFYVVKNYNAVGKSTKSYFEHFDKLVNTGIPIAVYISPQFEKQIKEIMVNYSNVQLLGLIDVEDSWTYQQINVEKIKLPTNRNPLKDSLEYMVSQNTKIECINKTIETNPFNTENFAWIDFGIFHVIKDIKKSTKMLEKMAYQNIKKNSLLFPGCWELSGKYDYINNINWNFCGGFFVGHKDQLLNFYQKYQTFLSKFINQHNTMVWEVNIWSAMVHESNWKPSWYKADHDDSIINVPDEYFV